jgi:pyochelin synthetase
MTTTTALVAELARAGVKLSLSEDKLRVAAPKGQLSPELRDRITRHKAELVEWLSRQRTDAELPTVVHDAENLHTPFPPSDLQTSFLMGSQQGFEYHVRPHGYAELDFDELDPARFEQALNTALARQRDSIVVARPDMTLQVVRDPTPLRITVCDYRGLPESEATEKMMATRAAMERKEPPLHHWPWLDVRMSRYGNGRARLHYNNNNFFTDAPSSFGLIADALHYYHYPERRLPRLDISYRDCVLALAALEESPLGKQAENYWLSRVADWPPAPDIPLRSGHGDRGRSMLVRRELIFPPDLWETVKKKAAALGLTLTSTLLGAHAEVISFWSGSRHFLLNNMITHRMPLHPQMNQVLGNFASLYPLEIDWRHDEPFHERVNRLQKQIMADVSHLYYSGVKVLQALSHARRTPGRAVCPFAVGSALFVGRTERPYYSMLETPQTLIDTEFWELPDGSLWVIWDVIEAMFPDGLIDAMEAGYRSVIHDLAGTDSAWECRAFDLLPATQRTARERLNRPVPAARDGLLHSCLPRRARSHPAKPAVIAGQRRLGYARLLRHTERVAGELRGHGVGPGDLAAVVLPKGWEQVAAVFGVLTAGAAYVPIDPTWPPDRIAYLINDTKAAAVLTSEPVREIVAGLSTAPLVIVSGAEPPADGTVDSADTDDSDGTVDPDSTVDLDSTGDFDSTVEFDSTADSDGPQDPDDLAYVIYTSGSTGRPKGAMLSHRGPLNTITDINRRFGIGQHDVVFGISSLCFDLSVYDIFGTIDAGATLVLPAPEQSAPAAWVEIMRQHEVTVWNSVPALMQLCAEAADSAGVRLPALRTVLLSGDWIPVDLPARIRQVAPNARVISLGGATEASIWSICFPVDTLDTYEVSIPYGKPLSGQSWHVLDSRGRDAPTWVAGELHIGGAGLALGYLGDEDKTRAAFVTHPRTGERLYRTGDLGRYLPSGDIEFLGRADFQVKIQGFRVEPGEIEHALAGHPGVRQAVVTTRTSGSGKQLVAFVDRANDGELSQGGLQDFLAGRLPGYMIPSRITVLDRLPLTGNGKIDRRQLDAMNLADTVDRREHVAPRDETEAALADIWETILGVTPVGVHDNFFDLGGQSFAALRVVGLIGERLGQRVTLGKLIEHPTIARLAERLGQAQAAASPLIRLRETAAGDPWFFVHPAGGSVMCYRDLAELLDGPCHALQAAAPAAGREAPGTVEEMAAVYLDAVRQVRQNGPYRLGGWSSGAIVAFEMARQLEKSGEPVDRVAVIDAPAPVAPATAPETAAPAMAETGGETDVLLWFLEDLGIGFDPGRVQPGQRRELAGAPPGEHLSRALALARDRGADTTRLSGLDLAATLAIFRRVVRACGAYRPPAISAPIIVVRARDGAVTEFAGHPAQGQPDWGWSSLTTGGTRATVVPGTHHTLLADPVAVAIVADTIARGPHSTSAGPQVTAGGTP